jgi:predicted DNA-binding protein (MmcQ/YjbR family)
MVTAARFRTLCLSLPGAEEKSHFGKADFRVANKIFAGFSEDPQRGYFKARVELREELLATPASPFTPAQGAWGQHGWTYVELLAVKLPILRELVAHSWRLVAPALLVSSSQLDKKPLRARRVRERPPRRPAERE